MSIYSVGLRNVGSYRVSGQPYLTGSSVNAGSEVKIEFPFVTKSITIRIPSPPNNATRVSSAGGNIAYWWSFTTGYPGYAAGDPGLLTPFGSSQDFTYGFWFKAPIYRTADLLFGIYGSTAVDASNPGLRLWMGQTSDTQLVFYIKDAGDGAPAGSSDYDTGALTVNNITTSWNHILITQLGGNTLFYINGSLAATAPSRVIRSSDNIQSGWNAGGKTALDSSFDESTMWNTGMTGPQVSEHYNSGEWVNPNYLSLKDNLRGWWTWGDSSGVYAPGITVDTHKNVFKNESTGTALSSSAQVGISRNTPGSEVIEYVPGPFTSQTTGKLRVHMASKADADVYNNLHYQELQGYGSTITLPMKTKELYFSAVDTQVSFEIIAELTNIPTQRMYNLAGSGIDE